MAVDRNPTPPEGVQLTSDEKRRQRGRSIAIALVLVALVVLFYAVTIVKIGGNVTTGGG